MYVNICINVNKKNKKINDILINQEIYVTPTDKF